MKKIRKTAVDYGSTSAPLKNDWAWNSTCWSNYNPDNCATLAGTKTQHLHQMNTGYLIETPQIAGNEIFESTEMHRPYFNNCDHYNMRAVCLDYCAFGTQVLATDPSWGELISAVSIAGKREPFPNFSLSEMDWVADTDIICVEDLDSYQREAWHSMQPRFEGQISMLNFLYELRDFKSLLKHFALLKPGNIMRMLREGVKPTKRLRDLDPSKALADLYLTNELAIKPLLMDLGNIMSQIFIEVDKAQRNFEIAGQTNQKSHYGATLCEVDSRSAPSGAYTLRQVEYGAHDETLFNATLEYQYQYDCRPRLEAFMKYWGLSGSYEALWNAVPWTFVADYFTGIGKSIHMMEHDKNVHLEYSQYCESLLRTKRTGVFYTADPSYAHTAVIGGKTNGEYSKSELVSGLRGSTYQRRVTSPNKGAALPRFKIPGGKQGLTMAALLRTFF